MFKHSVQLKLAERLRLFGSRAFLRRFTGVIPLPIFNKNLNTFIHHSNTIIYIYANPVLMLISDLNHPVQKISELLLRFGNRFFGIIRIGR